MSIELYTFLDVLPDQHSWQTAIDRIGVDLKLDSDLDLGSDEGFSPCRLAGSASGFEIYLAPTSAIVGELPSAAAVAGTRPHALTFRWGGDFAEAACVLAANLALVSTFGAAVYDPSVDAPCDEDTLKKELSECMARM